MALNPKQQRFVEEYLIDLNATQAYRRAYPNCKTNDSAEVNGHKLLRNAKVQAEIQKRQTERANRMEVTADKIVRELARIAFVDRRKLFSWGPDGVSFVKSEDLDEDAAAVVEEVSQTVTKDGGTIRVKTATKTEALNLLGKRLGLWLDKMEVSGGATMILTEEIIDGDGKPEAGNPPDNTTSSSPA